MNPELKDRLERIPYAESFKKILYLVDRYKEIEEFITPLDDNELFISLYSFLLLDTLDMRDSLKEILNKENNISIKGEVTNG